MKRFFPLGIAMTWILFRLALNCLKHVRFVVIGLVLSFNGLVDDFLREDWLCTLMRGDRRQETLLFGITWLLN